MMKNRILWLFWILCVSAAAIFTGSWLYAAVLLISGLLLVGSVIFNLFSGKKIAGELTLPKASPQSEAFRGKLVLDSQSVLPVFLGKGTLLWENTYTKEKGELPLTFSIGSKGKTTVDFHGKSNWCGNIRFQLKDWKCCDFFGVASRKKKIRCLASTVVMPPVRKQDFSFLTREGFDMESFRYSGNRPGDDPGETFDIREYREGDSIRQIHWKLTGKLENLMIREKSFPVDDTVLILAEAVLEEKNPAVVQTVAEVFSTVLQSFLEQGISCQAGVHDGESGRFRKEKIRSLEDCENMMYLFLHHGGEGEKPCAISQYLQDPGPQNFANYIYITGNSNIEEARLLRSRGEVMIVSCGTHSSQNEGDTITWKYGSPSEDKPKSTTDSCQVSCWKLP